MGGSTDGENILRIYFDGTDFRAYGKKAGADAVSKKLGSDEGDYFLGRIYTASRGTTTDSILLPAGTYEYVAAGQVENSAYGISFSITNTDKSSTIVSHERMSTGGAAWNSTFTLSEDTNIKVSVYNMNGKLGAAIIRVVN